MNLDAYGKSAASQVARNYLDSHRRGKPMTKALVLKGSHGVGKTTLVRACAETYGYELIELNASMDRSKRTFFNLTHSGLTEGDRILFFDEADGLTKTQQGYLAKLLAAARCPVFIACNSAMERELNELCMVIEVLPVRGQQSNRLTKHMAMGGERLEHEDEPEERIKAALRGGKDDVPPGDWWMVNTLLLDNTMGGEPLQWDLWQSRYRRVGSDMAKYAQRALRLGLKQVDRPWTLRLRWGGVKKAAPKRAQGKQETSSAPPPAPTPPPPPTSQASDFF